MITQINICQLSDILSIAVRNIQGECRIYFSEADDLFGVTGSVK
jgi:hypothetical protein